MDTTGKQLLPSKKDPRKLRWQNIDKPKEKPRDMAAVRSEFVEKQRQRRESEKGRLKHLADAEAGQVDMFTGRVLTADDVNGARARLKEIEAEEKREKKREYKKEARMVQREKKKQTSMFDDGTQDRGQASMFDDEGPRTGQRLLQDRQASMFDDEKPRTAQRMLLSLRDKDLLPVIPV